MKAYVIYAKNAFRSGLAYRFDTFFGAIAGLIHVYVQIAVWQALFLNAPNGVTTDYGSIQLTDMIHYVLISMAVGLLNGNRVISELDAKIKSGEIAFDINRPVSLWGTLMSQAIGRNLFSFLTRFSVVAVVLLPFHPIPLPSLGMFMLFLIALALGFLTDFFISFTLGLTGFWYQRIWHMSRLKGIIVGFFCGGFVPLWFFPAGLARAAEFLPFQAIAFLPVSIFLGKMDAPAALLGILTQCAWVAALALLSYAVWRKGIGKLVVQGG